jgi:hypothetical protein
VNAERPLASRVPYSDIAVGAAAAALYAYRLGDWSLWLDETASLYFSRHPEQAFAQSAAAYFLLLDALFDRTGMSVVAGRALSAAFGVANVMLVSMLVRRCANPRAGLLAAALFGVCLFNLFWAQSIRYYTMLLTAELTATILMYEGIVRRRTVWLLLSGVAAAIGVCVHYSAVMMLPTWGLFLGMLGLFQPRLYAKSCLLACFLALLPFAIVIALRYPAVHALVASGDLGEVADYRRIAPLLARVGFYVGAPACLLAVAGAFINNSSREGKQLLLALAIAPLGAIIVMAGFGLANVSVHHALLSSVGLAGLAGIALDACWHSIASRWRRLIFASTAGYYAAWIALYFSVMHGDRPRWREAAEALTAATTAHAQTPVERPIYSTDPLVLAYYLGVPAEGLFRQKRVHELAEWDDLPNNQPAWVVIDAVTLPRDEWPRLGPSATCITTFKAHTWPRDRTVAVYRIGP